MVATLEPAAAEVSGSGARPLAELVQAEGATVLVLDRAAQDQPSVVAQAAALHAAGIRVRTLSLFYEEWLGKLPVGELERVSMMFDIGEVHRQRYTRVKRVVDVALGAAGTLVLTLVTPVVLVTNQFGNQGPLLYRQTRVGKNGEAFSILKFRTMRPTPEGLPDEWTGEDDPRITPFGHVLRRSHLDELPQVVNILRGELSVVGPRPEQPHYVEELSEKLPVLRHAPPGAPRPHRLGPGEVRLRGRRAGRPGEAPVRVLLPPAPERGPRPADRGPDPAQRHRRRRPLTDQTASRARKYRFCRSVPRPRMPSHTRSSSSLRPGASSARSRTVRRARPGIGSSTIGRGSGASKKKA